MGSCFPATARNSVAGEEGFEPSHAGIKIRCLNQLGDSPTLTPYGVEGEIVPEISNLNSPSQGFLRNPYLARNQLMQGVLAQPRANPALPGCRQALKHSLCDLLIVKCRKDTGA